MPSPTVPGSALWALSILRPGLYMSDVEVVQQRIALALSTLPGTCPLNPLFGCNVPDHVDEPIPSAVARVKRDILEALTFWVPEIKVRTITHSFQPGVIEYNITYSLTDGRQEEAAVRLTDGLLSFPGIPTTSILPASIPENSATFRPALSVDGFAVQPAPPAGGFSTLTAMETWVVSNWANYGAWGRLGNGVVLYLKNQYAAGDFKIEKLT